MPSSSKVLSAALSTEKEKTGPPEIVVHFYASFPVAKICWKWNRRPEISGHNTHFLQVLNFKLLYKTEALKKTAFVGQVCRML